MQHCPHLHNCSSGSIAVCVKFFLAFGSRKLFQFLSLQIIIRGKVREELKEGSPWDGLEVQVVSEEISDGTGKRERGGKGCVYVILVQ